MLYLLFPNPTMERLKESVLGDKKRPFFEDVPDIIAHPGRTHFFNVNCVSCHTESTRRAILQIDVKNSEFAFTLPKGISGVDPSVLAKDKWNVRNFGWFPDTLGGRPTVPSVTLRTGNEAAESAAFINREYLKIAPKPNCSPAPELGVRSDDFRGFGTRLVWPTSERHVRTWATCDSRSPFPRTSRICSLSPSSFPTCSTTCTMASSKRPSRPETTG